MKTGEKLITQILGGRIEHKITAPDHCQQNITNKNKNIKKSPHFMFNCKSRCRQFMLKGEKNKQVESVQETKRTNTHARTRTHTHTLKKTKTDHLNCKNSIGIKALLKWTDNIYVLVHVQTKFQIWN